MDGRDTVGARLSTARSSFGEDVLALDGKRDGFGLNEGGVEEFEVCERAEDAGVEQVGQVGERIGGEQITHGDR